MHSTGHSHLNLSTQVALLDILGTPLALEVDWWTPCVNVL